MPMAPGRRSEASRFDAAPGMWAVQLAAYRLKSALYLILVIGKAGVLA